MEKVEKMEMVKKIDGFAKFINAKKAIKKTELSEVYILDNGMFVVQFLINDEWFKIGCNNKVTGDSVHFSKSAVWDKESITYDYETLLEILEIIGWI